MTELGDPMLAVNPSMAQGENSTFSQAGIVISPVWQC